MKCNLIQQFELHLYFFVKMKLILSDVFRTFPDREFPGKFPKSHCREIFPHSREFRESEVEKNEASLELIWPYFATVSSHSNLLLVILYERN